MLAFTFAHPSTIISSLNPCRSNFGSSGSPSLASCKMARAGRPPFPSLQNYRQHPYLLPYTNQQTGTSIPFKTPPSRTPAPRRQTQAPFDRTRPPPKNPNVENPDYTRSEGAVDWENGAKAKGRQVKTLET